MAEESVFKKALKEKRAKELQRYNELKEKGSVFAEFFNPDRNNAGSGSSSTTPWGTPYSGSKKTKSPWAGF